MRSRTRRKLALVPVLAFGVATITIIVCINRAKLMDESKKWVYGYDGASRLAGRWVLGWCVVLLAGFTALGLFDWLPDQTVLLRLNPVNPKSSKRRTAYRESKRMSFWLTVNFREAFQRMLPLFYLGRGAAKPVANMRRSDTGILAQWITNFHGGRRRAENHRRFHAGACDRSGEWQKLPSPVIFRPDGKEWGDDLARYQKAGKILDIAKKGEVQASTGKEQQLSATGLKRTSRRNTS